MKRRQFITLVGGAAAAWPLSARGKVTRKRPLIGRLTYGSTNFPIIAKFIERFLSGMRELGYVEGRDFDMTYGMADFHSDQLPRVAAEMVERAPDVILAGATLEAVAASKPPPQFRSLSLCLPTRLRSVSPRATPDRPAM
jgi:putative ABC transport system substrate-binding protein